MKPIGHDTASAHCPKCGKLLGADAPRGLCLACLFRGAASRSAHPRPAALPRRMGDYELLEFIARGGMGLVYKARHVPLNRLVALKVIAMGEMAAPDFVERFRIEAKAAASLDHPNIVSIYEVGEHEGQQFFAMKLVEGGSLAGKITSGSVISNQSQSANAGALNTDSLFAEYSPPTSAALLAKIARAVHYAHQRGILHRDIKPGNILLDARGEPFLTDFGLAKLLETDSDVTQTVAMLGTPAYMSPEQARGATKQLTTASDIYSLGAVLYELLAGRPPFTGASSVEILRQVVEKEPEPPGLARRKVISNQCSVSQSSKPGPLMTDSLNTDYFSTLDSDLEIICLKCLSKEPERRYPSAEALAEDLERWLRREPISARATTGVERGWLWCRRKPRQAATLALLAAVVVAGVAGVFTQWRRAETNRARAEQNSQRLEAEKITTRLHLYASDMSAAMGAWRDGNLGLARRLLEAQRPAPGPTNDLRGFEWRFLWQQLQGDQVRIFRGHSNLITSAAISPDLKSIVSGGIDGTLNWWDVDSGILHSNLNPYSDSVFSVGFARDGHHVAAGTSTRLKVFDLQTGARLKSVPEDVVRVALSPVSDVMAVGLDSSLWYGVGGRAYLIDYADGATNIVKLPDAGGRVAISGDGRSVATGMTEGRIQFWRAPKGELLGEVTNIAALASLALANDGSWLVAAVDFSPRLRVWSAPGGELMGDWPGHDLAIEAVAASPVSALVATGGRDQKILLWDMARREVVATLAGHESVVRALSFSADGEWLVSGGMDETVRLWRLRTARQQDTITNLSVHYGFGAPLISPDGNVMAASTKGRELKLYDTSTLAEVRTLAGPSRPLAFSPDGERLVTLSHEGDLELWEVKSGAPRGRITLSAKPELQAMSALAPAGDIVAVGGAGEVTLCDARSGALLGTLRKHSGIILALAFSPDGRRLATTGQDQKVRLWDVATRTNLTTLRGHKWDIRALVFSPDGRWLASAGHDNMIKIWDMTTLTEATTLKGNQSVISTLAFTPDGRTLLSASDDAVRFWNVATWREVGNLKPPVAAHLLVLSPATTCFAVADAIQQGPLHFWRVPTLAKIDGTPDDPAPSARPRWVLHELPAR